MTETLYTACISGCHSDCQEYSAVDRCICRCHSDDKEDRYGDEDDGDFQEANW